MAQDNPFLYEEPLRVALLQLVVLLHLLHLLHSSNVRSSFNFFLTLSPYLFSERDLAIHAVTFLPVLVLVMLS